MFTTIQLNNNDEYYTPKSAWQNIAHAIRSFGNALLMPECVNTRTEPIPNILELADVSESNVITFSRFEGLFSVVFTDAHLPISLGNYFDAVTSN